MANSWRPDLIFVFGSNLAGRHGKGSALEARQRYGAVYGQGEGLQGQSYGIPTKDEQIRTLPLARVRQGVERYVAFARQNPHLQFKVVNVGCMLAGYQPNDIAPMFQGAPENCFFSPEFVECLAGLGTRVSSWGELAATAPAEPQQTSLF